METYLKKVGNVLQKRQDEGLLRKLTLSPDDYVDFSSNDYLSFARDRELHERILHRTRNLVKLGSTGSRLLSGNNLLYEEVEENLRIFHNGSASLLFNSGYDLNLGVLGSLPQASDFIVFDELVHNSMREGMRLSRAQSVPFLHNNPSDLEQVLSRIRETPNHSHATVFVAVESVYSMDGHIAKLKDILEVCSRYNALVMIDEAHGLGILGNEGRGLTHELGLDHHPNMLLRIFTFGKALGCHGAVLIGPREIKSYLLNYCRPLIYSTSLSYHALISIDEGYKFMKLHANDRQKKLKLLVKTFKQLVGALPSLDSDSPIQGIILPGNDVVNKVSKSLQQLMLDVRPIRSPTVPKGTERIRIVLHYHNTVDEVRILLDSAKTTSHM